jgi:hypothetical protein
VRKHLLGVVVAIIVAFALAIGLGVATGKLDDPFSDKPEPGPKTETIVDEDGGTFTFPDGIVVIVPKGAVKEETTLSVGGITPLRAQDAGPFSDPASKGVRAGAVKFDVSLSRGDQRDIQPAKGKPLGITIPLRGKLKPMGVDTRLALLYTPGVKGKGYQLVPTQPAKSGILRGTLQHLSPKYVTYVSDQGLLDSFFPERVKEDRGTCKQEVSVNDTKVKISRDNSQGWSLEDGSPIFACLSKGSDGYVRVGIVNQLQFILSAAATDDVRLASSFGDPEEEVAKRLADLLFPNDKIKAYVGRDGKLVGSVGVDALPATVQLRGDPNTFLSEGAWQAIKLLTGILTGSSGNEIATTVLDAPAVITCVQSALRIGQGDLPSVAGVIDLVASKCTDQIVRALQPYVDPLNLLGRAQAISSGLWDIVKTTRTAFDGIRMQFNGTISVKIVGDTPASLKSFVGDWYSQPPNTRMTIRNDGTGERQSAVEAGGDYPVCTAHTLLRATPLQKGFRIMYLKSWFSDCPAGLDEVYSVGETVTYVAESDEAIIGNNWRMCREGALSRLSCSML